MGLLHFGGLVVVYWAAFLLEASDRMSKIKEKIALVANFWSEIALVATLKNEIALVANFFSRTKTSSGSN
jgi:hypothetical protein